MDHFHVTSFSLLQFESSVIIDFHYMEESSNDTALNISICVSQKIENEGEFLRISPLSKVKSHYTSQMELCVAHATICCIN